MRDSWLQNNQKNTYWNKSNIFSDVDSPVKLDYLEKRYGSPWRGMVLLSDIETRSKSPIDRERHGSMSQRTLEPFFQSESSPISRKKMLHGPSRSEVEINTCKAKVQVQGRIKQNNDYSFNNTMIPETIEELYDGGVKTNTSQIIRKKKFEKSAKDLKGDLSKDKGPVKTKAKIKPEFISQISILPGTVKKEFPKQKSGDIEKYRARLMLRTDQKAEKPGRQMIEGQGKWKSSYDILKQVIKQNK